MKYRKAEDNERPSALGREAPSSSSSLRRWRTCCGRRTGIDDGQMSCMTLSDGVGGMKSTPGEGHSRSASITCRPHDEDCDDGQQFLSLLLNGSK